MEDTLQDEVRQLVATYDATPTYEPTCTISELVVMCLVLHPGEKTQFIWDWIFETSDYRLNRLYRYWNDVAWYQAGDRMTVGFEEVFDMFEVPLQRVELRESEDTTDGSTMLVPVTKEWLNWDLYKVRWSVQTADARVFLSKHLYKEEKAIAMQTFPFDRLPAELRCRIYELALAYPKSGVLMSIPATAFGQPARAPIPHLLTRDYDKEAPLSAWMACGKSLTAEDFGNTMALLAANEQMYKEALPAFYKVNVFVFLDFLSLAGFLRRIGEDMRQHITHIKFFWTFNLKESADEVFRMLSTSKRLRRLDISLREDGFTRYGCETIIGKSVKDGRNITAWVRPFSDVLQLPGLSVLHNMAFRKENPVDIHFHGQCHTIRDDFEAKKAANMMKKAANTMEKATLTAESTAEH